MSQRLEILIPDSLDAAVRRAASRAKTSEEQWVVRTLERAVTDQQERPDAVSRLAALDAPTADLEQMLAEIEAGRR